MMRWASVLLLSAITACGGGGDGNNASTPAQPTLANNVATLIVESGPGNNVNIPYVSVTVCAPGTTHCRTIDHVLVDTGSTGLRLLAPALTGLALPQQTTPGSSSVLECAQFLNFITWGPVKLADIAIGGKRALSVPMQVIDDTGSAIIPISCGDAASVAHTTTDLAANGILGVGLFVNDGQQYFNCAPTSPLNYCKTSLSASEQVQNPVSRFASDNNGVVVQLPSIVGTGAQRVQGLLIFGIDTQPNNQLGNAKVIQTDFMGNFTTLYKGRALHNSFIDSGSNGLYFDDADLTPCNSPYTGFYCPATTQNLNATIGLADGSHANINFDLADASALLVSPGFAFSNLGGSMAAATFDWGLPFFFGRTVYTVIEGRGTSAGHGPLFAFTP